MVEFFDVCLGMVIAFVLSHVISIVTKWMAERTSAHPTPPIATTPPSAPIVSSGPKHHPDKTEAKTSAAAASDFTKAPSPSMTRVPAAVAAAPAVAALSGDDDLLDAAFDVAAARDDLLDSVYDAVETKVSLIRKIESLVGKKLYGAAIKELESALKQHPDEGALWVLKCECHEGLQERRQLMASATRLLEVDPSRSEGYAHLMRAHDARREVGSSLRWHHKAFLRRVEPLASKFELRCRHLSAAIYAEVRSGSTHELLNEAEGKWMTSHEYLMQKAEEEAVVKRLNALWQKVIVGATSTAAAQELTVD